MAFEACLARQERCREADEGGYHNPVFKCRGCAGYESMIPFKPSPIESKSRHYRYDKYTHTCEFCGREGVYSKLREDTRIGDKYICDSCFRALQASALMDATVDQVRDAVLWWLKNKDSVKLRLSWRDRIEKHINGWTAEKDKTPMAKVGKCAACGRMMALPHSYQGHRICATCRNEVKVARDAGWNWERFCQIMSNSSDDTKTFPWRTVEERMAEKKEAGSGKVFQYSIPLDGEIEIIEKVSTLTPAQRRSLAAHMVNELERFLEMQGAA